MPEQTDQIVVALTLEQSEMVRSLLYSAARCEPDREQRAFMDVLLDQFEQAEAEA